MSWVGGEGITDGAARGRVAGDGVDGNPVGAAGRGHHATGQSVDADGVIGEEIAVIHVGEAESEGARSGVLRDSQRLAVDGDRTGAGQVRRVGRDGVVDNAAIGVVGGGSHGDPVGPA